MTMNTQTNPNTNLDDADWSWRDEDPGDYIYCRGCGEWILPIEHTEIDNDVHKIVTRLTCPFCDGESETV